MHTRDTDHTVFRGLRVDRPFPSIRIAKDGRHRRIPFELEVGESPIIPNTQGRELEPFTRSVIVVGGCLHDCVLWALFFIRIAELHDIEGWVRRFLDVEIIAPAVGIDGNIGVEATRERLDGKGPPARHAVDLEPFRVAGDDRPDALTFAELDGCDMGQGDTQPIDLTFLIGRDPDTAVIRPAARDSLCKGDTRGHQKNQKGDQETEQVSSPICQSVWRIRRS